MLDTINGYTVDSHPLCSDFTSKSFLRRGVTYRFPTIFSLPEIVSDLSDLGTSTQDTVSRVILDQTSPLYFAIKTKQVIIIFKILSRFCILNWSLLPLFPCCILLVDRYWYLWKRQLGMRLETLSSSFHIIIYFYVKNHLFLHSRILSFLSAYVWIM